MLFEMLAGRRPFEVESGAGATTILLSIMQDAVPDLSAFRPDVPKALAVLINRMLEKDRNQRIGSIRQVGAELETILSDLKMGGETRLVSSPQGTTLVAPESRFASMTPTPSSVNLTDTAPDKREFDFKVEFVPPQASAAPAAQIQPTSRKGSRRWTILAVLGGFILGMLLVGGLFQVFLSGDDDGDSREGSGSAHTPNALTPAASATTEGIAGAAAAPTDTAAPTATLPVPSATPTATPTLENTPTTRPTDAATSTATSTATQRPTDTPSPTITATSAPPPLLEPTVLYPQGYRLALLYNEVGFHLWNPGNRAIRLSPLVFEALRPADAAPARVFEGARWTALANYAFVDQNSCVIIEPGLDRSKRPAECRALNAQVNRTPNSTFIFWIPEDGVAEFRVLWEGQEIARCPAAASGDTLTCNVYLPPQ
jgi:hypothetical protein